MLIFAHDLKTNTAFLLLIKGKYNLLDSIVLYLIPSFMSTLLLLEIALL